MLGVVHLEAWQGVLHSPTAWAFTFLLAVVFPLVDYLAYHRLKSRLQIYAWNMVAEWLLVAACLGVAYSMGLRLADLGEQLGSPSRSLLAAGVLAIVVGGLTFAGKISRKKRQLKAADSPQVNQLITQIRRILPVTASERKVFIAVAITAGVCEEFLYRGWLLNLFANVLGSVWIGLLISSILFGIAHAYQGRRGVFGTGALGAVFGAVFVVTGSLFLSQLLHAAMDINNGLALGKVAARLESSS